MPAQDPISLFFLGCALFSALFLVASATLGAHGHSGHIGAHAAGHVAGHVGGHVAGHTTGHVAGQLGSHDGGAHTGQTDGAHANQTGQALAHISAASELWDTARGALLGALNLNALLIFLLVFGLLGFLLRVGGWPVGLAFLLAAPVGVAGALAANVALAKLFYENEAGELSARSSQIEGRLGTVSIAIRPGGIGEIIFPGEAGARQSMGARAEDASAAIAVETEVVVTSVENGIATVQPWNILLEETKLRLMSDHASGPPATPPAQ
jgi:membrane protein implicated in regulation of membrane protease activity